MAKTAAAPKQPTADELQAESKALATRAKPFGAWLKVADGSGLASQQLDDLRTSMVAIKELRKELETRRKSYVDPLNGMVKRINAECKASDMPLAILETHCKVLLTQSLVAQQAEALKGVQRAAKAAERKGDVQYAEDLRQNAISTVTVASNGVSTRSTYMARVDIVAVLKGLHDGTIAGIERDALLLGFHEVAVKVYSASARSAKTTQCSVPGVTFVEEKIVSVSA